MNKKETPAERHGRTINLLFDNRLGEAIQNIGVQLGDVTDWRLTSEYDNLNTAYNYMLQYFEQGVPDTARETLHSQLIARAILLNDDALDAVQLPASMLLADQARRQYQNRPFDYEMTRKALERFNAILHLPEPGKESPDIIKVIADHEQILSAMFTEMWTSQLWEQKEQNETKGIIQSADIALNDRLLLISAVTLALTRRFDPRKLLLLGELASSDETAVSVRATTGFLLAVARYQNLLPYFPEITAFLKLMSDSIDIQTNVESIQFALFLSRETDEVDRKMREEIIPAMLKNVPQDIKPDDVTAEEGNPDWQKWMDESGVQDKLLEMTELQMEGADIYMSTFSGLKNYPFFRDISGWFRPFDYNQPDIRSSFVGTELMKTYIGQSLLQSGIFCNSDKYSFCLTFQQIPESQRHQIIEQIMSHSEETELAVRSEDTNRDRQYRQQARQYVQDLYRFFKLFPRRHEFWNPFLSDTNLFDVDALDILTSNPQFERTAAEFLLKKKHYSESASLFERLVNENGPESTDWQIWQKLGYALQKDEKPAEAIEAYEKADILEPDNAWTMKHLAQCHRDRGNWSKAVEYILSAESSAPEDLQLTFQAAEILTSAEQYDEALKRFFKIEFHNPNSIRTKRGIAWCAFLCGKYDQSRKYWNEILTDSQTAQDFLNAGHLEWCSGNIQLAISMYRHAKALSSPEQFADSFASDISTLKSKGIPATDISLMQDILAKDSD